MIRTSAVPRPARIGATLVGVAGILTLAGCGTSAATADPESSTNTEPSVSAGATPSATADDASNSGSASGAYKDGTYSADGSYATPETVETISVTVTLKNDTITDVEITNSPQKAESKEYQSKFIGGINDAVVGKNIDEISVTRVAGSSLTSGGFSQAIQEIKAEAAA